MVRLEGGVIVGQGSQGEGPVGGILDGVSGQAAWTGSADRSGDAGTGDRAGDEGGTAAGKGATRDGTLNRAHSEASS